MAEQSKVWEELRKPIEPKVFGKRGQTVEQRLLRRSALVGGCWEWQGARNPKGYGYLRPTKDSAAKSVHRLSYEAFVREIPKGMEIDHLCSNRACINPEHLQPIPHAENVRRGRHNQNHGKPLCKWGHEFTDRNTLRDKRGNRACKRCAAERMRAFRAGVQR